MAKSAPTLIEPEYIAETLAPTEAPEFSSETLRLAADALISHALESGVLSTKQVGEFRRLADHLNALAAL